MISDQSFHDATQLPPISELLSGSGRPTSWVGMEVSWSSAVDPMPVFLGRFQTSEGDEGVEVFLFGARYELSEALLNGESLGDGFFEEYFVVLRRREGGWDLRRLLQRRSVTYAENEDLQDYVPVNSLSSVRDRIKSKAPDWESAAEAVWPTSHGEPMIFLGQVRLDDNQSIRNSFTWGMTVYLFWEPRGRGEFKIVTQPCGEQTPEDHYDSEEQV